MQTPFRSAALVNAGDHAYDWSGVKHFACSRPISSLGVDQVIRDVEVKRSVLPEHLILRRSRKSPPYVEYIFAIRISDKMVTELSHVFVSSYEPT